MMVEYWQIVISLVLVVYPDKGVPPNNCWYKYRTNWYANSHDYDTLANSYFYENIQSNNDDNSVVQCNRTMVLACALVDYHLNDTGGVQLKGASRVLTEYDISGVGWSGMI